MGRGKFAMGYLDDIYIFINNEIEHLQHIEEIFNRLERFGLKMKSGKCDFFKRHIQYLGHLITEDRFTPLAEKLESIRNIPKPKTPRGETILRFDRLLQEIHAKVLGYSQISHESYKT